jgi:hypothetical protein
MFSVANPAQTQAVFPTVLNWWNAGSPFYVLGGWNFAFTLPNGSKTTSYQLSDDLVKTRGKHKGRLKINFTDLGQWCSSISVVCCCV